MNVAGLPEGCNGNGRIDVADVVWLFNHLRSLFPPAPSKVDAAWLSGMFASMGDDEQIEPLSGYRRRLNR